MPPTAQCALVDRAAAATVGAVWWSGVEATYVDDAPRPGWLALWTGGVGEPVGGADHDLDLVVPAGAQVRRRTMRVRRLPLRDAIDDLVDLPATAEVSASVRAWAVATRLSVDLAARGRLLPSAAADGTDTWILGPLDAADVVRRDELVAALPPGAHAVPVPGSKPLRVVSPEVAVASFSDAIADLLPRTAAAPLVTGHTAFAAPVPDDRRSSPRRGARQVGRTSPRPHRPRTPPAPPAGTDVSGAADWLAAVTTGAGDEAAASLRLEPPEPADADFLAVLQLQSRRDPSLVVSAADLWTAPAAVVARFGEEAETAMLLSLRRGARVWPPLGRLLDDARPERLVLDDEEAADLLGPVVDDLASAGVQVLWPADVLRSVDLRPQIATPSPAAVTAAGFTLESLCELRWRATLDGEQLTDEELAVLAHAKRPVVRLRGRWVRADPERLALLRKRRTIGAGAALAAALGGTIEVDGERVGADVVGPLADLAARLGAIAIDGHPRLEPPHGLHATLRPYQERGLAWLAEMADLGLGGVLADDMGLGKTIQLLALHLARHDRDDPDSNRPTLVVCPASLVGNWQREAGRFAPGMPVRRFHGSARTLDGLGAVDIVVATYGVVRRDTEALAAVEWGIVAADEAQAVKNPLSRTARALRSIPAGARFALTGTPVENRLTELWAILDWTTPGLLGPLERFRRQVAVPVERDRDADATRTLTTLVRPFVLRRRKSDPNIAPELPPRTETDRFVPLAAEQATLYTAVVEETLARIAEAEGMARRGLVLKLITALKQICNHPAHYLGQAGPLPGRSGKLDAAAELLAVIAEEGAHALVVTQYVAMGRLLERHLGAAGLRTLFLHGSVPVPAREEMVDRFQAGEAHAFVISLKAGGTGLNLTRATHVVHFDRWWNPAVEDQASDRAWRIGQRQPVQVHRLITEGTVEERIASLLTSKRDLADRVVGSGEGWVSELGDDELAALVRLGGDAVNGGGGS